MPTHLCVTFHLPGRTFHGVADDGAPEWPPSPLRAFQAMVRAAAQGSGAIEPDVRADFAWLENLCPPRIVAPPVEIGVTVRCAVPNNDLDVVFREWARDREGGRTVEQLKTLKSVRALHLDGGADVHYLYQLDTTLAEAEERLARLSRVAHKVVALGWGIDLAVSAVCLVDNQQVDDLEGEHWVPSEGVSTNRLRVPVLGTFEDLVRRHVAFLTRLSSGHYIPPARLSRFARVAYRRNTDRARPEGAAFSLLKVDGSGFRAFDPVRRGLRVAGMVRRATAAAAAAAGWPEAQVNAFVLGHGEAAGEIHVPAGPRRFVFLPLPSLEHRAGSPSAHIGAIRRVLLTAYQEGCEAELAWSRRGLSGRELVDERTGEVAALISVVPLSDQIVQRYLHPAVEWATVTPVVLPGYDDPGHLRRRLEAEPDAETQRRLLRTLDRRVDALLRRSLSQAGWPDGLVRHAELEWRGSGFLPGVDLAGRYGVPDHLRRFPRLHVRLGWRTTEGVPTSIAGPLCIGAGRYYGLGLFAPA